MTVALASSGVRLMPMKPRMMKRATAATKARERLATQSHDGGRPGLGPGRVHAAGGPVGGFAEHPFDGFGPKVGDQSGGDDGQDDLERTEHEVGDGAGRAVGNPGPHQDLLEPVAPRGGRRVGQGSEAPQHRPRARNP